MREIHVDNIIETIKGLCIDTNYYISPDIYESFKKALKTETSEIGQSILEQLVDNADLAAKNRMPICQDTGMAVVFMEIGQEACIIGGDIKDAVNEGVRRGYQEGFLRKSIVKDPFFRENTGDNTPAIIHYDIVPGNQVKITVAPKGFGSENMSRIYMLKPSDGIEGAKRVIVETVDSAGSNACPPMIIGVGIGGTFEKAALLAKKALLRPVGVNSDNPFIRDLEIELLDRVNHLGVGPQGLGGITTALALNIEVFPTHIAGLPVAINIGCHVTRHRSEIL